MANYCVDKSGEHEVHDLDSRCRLLPAPHHQLFLGNHFTRRTALVEARQYFPQADGCALCVR